MGTFGSIGFQILKGETGFISRLDVKRSLMSLSELKGEIIVDTVIIRRALEQEFRHVTFFRSDRLKSFWKATKNEVEFEFIFELVMGNNDLELLVNNRKNNPPYISTELVIKLEKLLIENYKAEEIAEIEKQKNSNQTGEIKMSSVVETMSVFGQNDNKLKNGVIVHKLDVENDFHEAQGMFNLNYETENIDAESAYNDRVETDKLGTYEIFVQRFDDYYRFVNMLDNALCKSGEKMKKIRDNWYNDVITNDEYQAECEILNNCKCKICALRTPTIEEWMTGKYVETVWNDFTKSNKTKETKLGKTLLKAGYEQSIVDFYSAQIKTEKSVFVTISDRVQHITGMSTYAKPDSWNGWNGTSCQDFRHDGSMVVSVAGSLYDNKLFIAMMHDELEDIEDMEDKLKARVMMRLVNIDGKQYMIPTHMYGNNTTRNLLDKSLDMLNEVGIYGMDIKGRINEGDRVKRHMERANGTYTIDDEEEVHIETTIDEYVSVDCPMCSGSGRYEVTLNDDREVEVDCPMCSGSGNYEVNVYQEVDEYVTVNDDREITVYGEGEGYTHNGYNIEISVNTSQIERDVLEYSNEVVVSEDNVCEVVA